MAEVPSVRASDAEREEVVARLRGHSVDGRLTLEEFAQRVEAVYAATTRAELERVTADLPAARRTGPRRRPRRLTAVIFGAVERTGRWRMPRRALALVLVGVLRLARLLARLVPGVGVAPVVELLRELRQAERMERVAHHGELVRLGHPDRLLRETRLRPVRQARRVERDRADVDPAPRA